MNKYNSHWNILIKKETGYTIDELVERATKNNYVVTEYCKTKLVETTIASNLSKKDAHRLRELLNTYANKENKVRYKCYDWSE